MIRRLNEAQKKEIDRIGKACRGKLKAEAVVAAAEDPASPLHALFQWDDKVAARERRLDIARDIIRVYVVVMPAKRRPVRAWVSVSTPGYRSIASVMSSEQLRSAHLETALSAAEEFANRYPELEEWEIVRSAIISAVAKIRGRL